MLSPLIRIHFRSEIKCLIELAGILKRTFCGCLDNITISNMGWVEYRGSRLHWYGDFLLMNTFKRNICVLTVMDTVCVCELVW